MASPSPPGLGEGVWLLTSLRVGLYFSLGAVLPFEVFRWLVPRFPAPYSGRPFPSGDMLMQAVIIASWAGVGRFLLPCVGVGPGRGAACGTAPALLPAPLCLRARGNGSHFWLLFFFFFPSFGAFEVGICAQTQA